MSPHAATPPPAVYFHMVFFFSFVSLSKMDSGGRLFKHDAKIEAK